MSRQMAWVLALGLTSLGATQAAAIDLAQADGQSGLPAAAAATIGPDLPPAAIPATAAGASKTASLAIDEPASDGSGWEVAVTPYLWLAGVKGDIGIPRGDEVEIDQSFTDILGNLKFAFMGALDVRNGRFVALADVIFLSVGAEAEGTLGPGFVEGEIDASVFVSTGALGYRVVDRGPMFVDLVVGARVVSLDAKVELTGPLMTREREASKSNVSALVGGRIRVPLGENWGAALYGDIGTGSAKWQMLATIQWDISDHWRLAAGYRHLSINHDKENFNFDIALSGPIVGVSYRF